MITYTSDEVINHLSYSESGLQYANSPLEDALGIPDEFLTDFASHNKSPALKGMFRSLVPRHVEETSSASPDLCSSKNRREGRTSPTDPASSSPGSFYVTAL